MSSSVADAKGLEGKSEEEGGDGVAPREFFWDSITLYVVFAIISLSSIDLVIEFVRQPEVRCFSRDNQDELEGFQDYVNEFCYGTSALSNINTFRIFTYILAFLIAALHYLWLNNFGGRFASFFQLASDIERHREEDSGEYPKSNLIIADQLEDSFTTYKQNTIYAVYFAKLFAQLLAAMAGLAYIAYYFTRLEFGTSFLCPDTLAEANDTSGPWPLLGKRVTCVYTSFPLLELICIADMALLGLTIILLSFSLVWCTASHTKELGYKDVAAFVFQTGLPSRYFIPSFHLPLDNPNLLQKFLYLCFSSVPWFPLRGPRIKTDLDFMMMRLFRTDGGLGHVLKEILILKEVKMLNDNDTRNYRLHWREQKSDEYRTGDLINANSDIADLNWIFDKDKSATEVLRVPYTIRGAVLGFSSYVQYRAFALCISFGSPSIGFATALHGSCVYQEEDDKEEEKDKRDIFILNYTGDAGAASEDSEKEVILKKVTESFEPEEKPSQLVKVKELAEDDLVTITCPEDVLSTDKTKDEFINAMFEACGTNLKINFVLVSPMTKSFHRSTLTYLMDEIKGIFFAEDAVLLTICPQTISGSPLRTNQDDTDQDFYQFKPTANKKYFQELNTRVRVIRNKSLIWPKFDTEDNRAANVTPRSTEKLPLYVVDSSKKLELRTEVSFKMYQAGKSNDDKSQEVTSKPKSHLHQSLTTQSADSPV